MPISDLGAAVSAKRYPYRVLLVDFARTFGGVEVRVISQAQALQSLVEVCKVAVLKGSALHERLRAENVPHEVIDAGRANPQIILALRKIIREGGYQIVDAHNVQSILWAHPAALGVAKGRVTTIHGNYTQEYPGLKGRIYDSVLLLNRLMARQYITVTEVLQERAKKRGLGEKTTLIHNAVPVPPEPLPSKNLLLVKEWGFSPSDFVVANIARLVYFKGQTFLLKAFALLKDMPHVKLLIAGDGPLMAELQAEVQSLGIGSQVHFAGFVANVAQILPSIDCMCMSSVTEGMPYAVLEAASYARPLVVTAAGGMATMLENGQTGLVVPPREPAALADGIRWMVQHPDDAQRMGQAARTMVKETLSIEKMVLRVLEVYERALT